jgi:hypothetical protein
MVRYTDESTVPVARDRIWRLLELHAQDDQITRVHPEVVSQQTLSQAPGEYTAKRSVKILRKLATATWKVTSAPPDRYRWEVLDGNGPWTAGSYLSIQYADVPGGTRLTTEGDLTVVGIPGFLQNRIVRLVLGRIDNEDAAFLAKSP